MSVVRRKAGVSGQVALAEQRSARVAAMTGIDRAPAERDVDAAEFPPALDLIAPVIGTIGIIAAGARTPAGPAWLAIARFLVGAAFMGAVTDAMLLGHWYLVQPGLARGPLLELVHVDRLALAARGGAAAGARPAWSRCSTAPSTTATTACSAGSGWPARSPPIGLVIVTRLALKERYYSAVMAATGLLYLAILTAFGTDLVARALLS